MFRLLGDPPQAAALHATQVLKMETSLAKSSLTVTERRDPARLYHKMPVTELQGMNPTFGWSRYLRATDTPAVESLNVAVPDFFKGLEALLKQQDLPSIKTYLRWHLVHDLAPMLLKAFANE